MQTSLDCVPCLLRQSLEATRAVTADVGVQEHVIREVLRMLAELELNQPPPLLAQAVHRRLRELTGADDPYQRAKTRFNRLAMDALPELRERVRHAEDPLLAAAQFAVAANAIDMGISSAITDEAVREALRGTLGEPVHGEWREFVDAAAEAKNILYLTDNAGEIAVDRLVIEVLGPERVTVAVRGAPVLNDATVVDAREVGMVELTQVIDNGSDAPGTLIDDCSSEFLQHFDRADLIIAKGQGNFESLSGTAANVAFWFKVKCEVVSRQIGLPVGAHALLSPGHKGTGQ
ncbi:ARMT1-like domain-containing protein [Hydrogenophaga sp.]|uniref:damage-control phosphatase ARMT1 family protein n=1 Tax=Hydrogenophaga sp. TaxID=1904254 RepID=UPI0025C00EF8|nr:ARMT1-like domain-containing protein [Hydrogenophaga sp.]